MVFMKWIPSGRLYLSTDGAADDVSRCPSVKNGGLPVKTARSKDGRREGIPMNGLDLHAKTNNVILVFRYIFACCIDKNAHIFILFHSF